MAPFQLNLVFELADFLKTQLVPISKHQSQTESLLCLGVRTSYRLFEECTQAWSMTQWHSCMLHMYRAQFKMQDAKKIFLHFNAKEKQFLWICEVAWPVKALSVQV